MAKTSLKNKQERTDSIIALVITALFGFFIFGILHQNKDEITTSTTTATHKVQQEPPLLESSPILNTKAVVLEKEATQSSKKKLAKKNNISTQHNLQKSTDGMRTDGIIQTPPEKVTKEVVLNDIPEKGDQKTILDTVNSARIPKKTTNFKKRKQEIVCLVIVKSSLDNDTIQAIEQKLKKEGYQFKQDTLASGLKYIGVPVDCASKIEKRQLIKRINQSFSTKSWVKRF